MQIIPILNQRWYWGG